MRFYGRSRIFFLVMSIIFSAYVFSSCKPVSEEIPDIFGGLADTSVTSVTSVTESTADTAVSAADPEEKISSETGEASSEAAGISEETRETSAKTTETVSVSTSAEITEAAETRSEITEAAETRTEVTEPPEAYTEASSLTLQPESPPEAEWADTYETAVAGVWENVSENSYRTVNFAEQKGFWITYLEYMSILKNKSQSEFKRKVDEYFGNISALGFNTVYVQVRAFGDAYYNSKLFPSGEQFDGTIGTENSFDALQVMIDCAHKRGMSVHAWVNPMRLMSTAQLKNINGKYLIKKWYDSSAYRGTYIVESGGKWYLNPAYDETTDLIAAGIAEIVENYDVDGIQIDDYFYPTTAASFDSKAYSAKGGGLSLSSWRIKNVNRMVKKLYKAAHEANSSIVFGISPQGSVENNYDELYADVRTWCAQDGYCDYILPQVYFGFKNAALPYDKVADQWSGMVTNPDIQLVIGLAAYKIGAEDKYAGSTGKNEWLERSDIMARQISYAKKLNNYGGVSVYRYESLFAPASAVAKQVDKELKNIKKND